MKIIISFIFLISAPYSAAKDSEISSIIKDPVVSKRCKNLLKERSQKIRVQQKLNSLILRNKNLSKKTRPNQLSTQNKLELNATQLKNHLRLTNYQVKNMEEAIVRKGCPGITL